MNKYLVKISSSSHDRNYDDYLYDRLDMVEGANDILAHHGYKPRIHDNNVGARMAEEITDADWKAGLRPEHHKGQRVGILAGLGGAALGGIGASALSAQFGRTASPLLALTGALAGGVMAGRSGYKAYYTPERKDQDSKYQEEKNKYLHQVLSKYEKDDDSHSAANKYYDHLTEKYKDV